MRIVHVEVDSAGGIGLKLSVADPSRRCGYDRDDY